MRKGKAASRSPPIAPGDNKAFPTPSSTYGLPALPFFLFLVKYPTIHKFMATVEIHGATTFILGIFSLILSVSSISQFSPSKQVLGSSGRWDAVGPLEGAEGWVSSVLRRWQAPCSTS